ncbi:MAG TPA: ABC transporter substrate-binding protein [Candidatus Binatia bacterium]|jgi:NitT/TauT family transport system substrate-binding protein
MRKIAGLVTIAISILFFADSARSQQQVLMGYSGAGISTDLRRVIEKEKLWDKYGLNVKAIYFNSGGVLTQAMAGGNIDVSDSDVPAMLGLAVSGVLDVKVISVTFNKLEHFFVVRKNITRPEDLKGKRVTVSRIGSASDVVTRMVLRQLKVDPEKEVTILQSGNTPTRVAALVAGHVEAALISPDSIAKLLATGCCRILVDLSELPMDYARFGGTVPASMIKTQRDTLRRYLMATIEGIYIFKTRPKLVYSIFEEEGNKDPQVQKELYARLSRSLREYPIPEPNGIQGALDSLANPNARTVKPASLMDTSIIEEIKSTGFIEKLYGRPPKT